MRNCLSQADDIELHHELCETELTLSIDDGVPRVELLLADHLGNGTEVCCYYTPLDDILDQYADENDKEDLQALAVFLRESLAKLEAKIAGE